jgi:hypothetical protein
VQELPVSTVRPSFKGFGGINELDTLRKEQRKGWLVQVEMVEHVPYHLDPVKSLFVREHCEQNNIASLINKVSSSSGRLRQCEAYPE